MRQQQQTNNNNKQPEAAEYQSILQQQQFNRFLSELRDSCLCLFYFKHLSLYIGSDNNGATNNMITTKGESLIVIYQLLSML